MERLHPNDRQFLLDERQKLHDGKKDQISTEYRYLHPDRGQSGSITSPESPSPALAETESDRSGLFATSPKPGNWRNSFNPPSKNGRQRLIPSTIK